MQRSVACVQRMFRNVGMQAGPVAARVKRNATYPGLTDVPRYAPAAPAGNTRGNFDVQIENSSRAWIDLPGGVK